VTKEEFRENIQDNHYYSSIVGKLAEELVQSGDEEIYSVFWQNEEAKFGDKVSERCYYVATNKRFFRIYVGPDSFGYKSCPMQLLNGFEEVITPHRPHLDDFEKSEYFGGGEEVGAYSVRLSFGVMEDDLKHIGFTYPKPGQMRILED